MELKGKIVNFLGDSITEGVGVENEENRFPDRIGRKYNLKCVNNYGISGTRIARQQIPTVSKPRHDLWFCSRVDQMDSGADAVVIFGGTNDWGHGDALIGSFEDRSDETFYGACHTLFRKCIERFPGKPIVVVTPLHRETEDELHVRGDRKLVLKDYVDIIKEVAQFYSLPVCDLYSGSGLQPKVDIIKEKFVPDGLHPNDADHEILADRIGSFLANL